MHVPPRPIILAVLCVVAAIIWSGCAATPQEGDPASALSSADASKRDQLAAVEAIRRDLLDGEAPAAGGREALKRIAWRRGAPNDVRLAAINALLEHDADDTASMLALMLPTETDWDVIGRVSDLARERRWTGLAPALVRSWSRPVVQPSDDDRPERRALEALFPDRSAAETVYEVFATPSDGRLFGERARHDAWALLQRIDERGVVTESLLRRQRDVDPADDPLLSDLQAAARELHVVPRTTEQLEWLRALRSPDRRAFWQRSAQAIASLSDAQRDGLALRHVAGAHWASLHEPSWLRASRAELLSELAALLDGRKRHMRTDGVVDFVNSRETLNAWEDELVWGDALMILIADRAASDQSIHADLFEQAMRDNADRSTEYGGLLDASGDGFVAMLFPPRPSQRLGDHRFVASQDLLDASVDGLFHYHFHAQQMRNRDYAGPGRGDLEYADALGRACIVFTFINRDTLNADYYQPGGARIDLGEVARPQ